MLTVQVTIILIVLLFFFFFQAEDGIRDRNVTGVQTCALPILSRPLVIRCTNRMGIRVPAGITRSADSSARSASAIAFTRHLESAQRSGTERRSEERRVGKECRSRRAR